MSPKTSNIVSHAEHLCVLVCHYIHSENFPIASVCYAFLLVSLLPLLYHSNLLFSGLLVSLFSLCRPFVFSLSAFLSAKLCLSIFLSLSRSLPLVHNLLRAYSIPALLVFRLRSLFLLAYCLHHHLSLFLFRPTQPSSSSAGSPHYLSFPLCSLIASLLAASFLCSLLFPPRSALFPVFLWHRKSSGNGLFHTLLWRFRRNRSSLATVRSPLKPTNSSSVVDRNRTASAENNSLSLLGLRYYVTFCKLWSTLLQPVDQKPDILRLRT